MISSVVLLKFQILMTLGHVRVWKMCKVRGYIVKTEYRVIEINIFTCSRDESTYVPLWHVRKVLSQFPAFSVEIFFYKGKLVISRGNTLFTLPEYIQSAFVELTDTKYQILNIFIMFLIIDCFGCANSKQIILCQIFSNFDFPQNLPTMHQVRIFI